MYNDEKDGRDLATVSSPIVRSAQPYESLYDLFPEEATPGDSKNISIHGIVAHMSM